MLTKRIIPCLDVDAGRVVKGVKFLGLRDAGDPVEVAQRYDSQGADELAFLDITASSEERDTILHIVERVASQVFIPLTVGGGVRGVEVGPGATVLSVIPRSPSSCAAERINASAPAFAADNVEAR